MIRTLILALMSLSYLTGCLNADESLPTSTLLIGSAASMEPVMKDLGREFQKTNPGTIEYVIASSGSISNQIANGAPIQIFASANQKFIKVLLDSGLILPENRYEIGEGHLYMVTRPSAHDLTDWKHATKDPSLKYIALAQPEVAPYGQAAHQALVKNNLLPLLKDKLVYGENVLQVLQLVETGNADIGFIAASQLIRIASTELVTFPVALCDHDPLVQSIAGVGSGSVSLRTGQFLDFVTSTRAQKLIETHGYQPIRTPPKMAECS